MNIIVVGCGRVGSTLAYQLYKKGHQVTVVDREASAFNNLPPDFGGRMEEGDVLSRDVLHRAGIEQADALATVTNSDSVNAVVAHVARTVYHVPNLVARNYDPRWRPLQEAFGLPVVSSASWGAQRMEELLFGAPLRAVFSAGNAEVEIYELAVPEKWHGRSLQELLPEGQCLIVALTRAGRAMLPSSDLRLEAGDVVYLSATPEGIEALRRRLDLGQEG
jgi:trk system potassium uptake protein TrkA